MEILDMDEENIPLAEENIPLKKIVLDTSVLMNTPNVLDDLINMYKVVIPIVVVGELDHLKTNKDGARASKARKAIRMIEKYREYIAFDLECRLHNTFSGNDQFGVNDDIIVSCAHFNNAYFMTGDLNLKIKAEAIGVEVVEVVCTQDEYDGYKTIKMTEEEMCYFYEHLDENTYGCLVNEYLIIMNSDNDIVDKYKWTGEKHVPLKYKRVNNTYIGKVSPRNVEQELAFDMLQDNTTTVKAITGGFGSGKSHLAVCISLELLQSKKYEKIILMRNNVVVKDTKEIGFLPGSANEKLMFWSMPFADKVGGKDGLEMLISQGKVELEHLGAIRGRDFRDSIIILTESENTTKELLQLLISRLGENSILILDGDIKQVDTHVYENNNGLSAVTDKLKGQELFAHVRLKKTERSKTAELAYLLD